MTIGPRLRTVPYELTPRQQEIVVMLLDGMKPRQIADKLGIATVSVRNMIEKAYITLDVHSVAELKEKMDDTTTTD